MDIFKNHKKLISMSLIPLISSVYAVFVIPQMFNTFTKNTIQYNLALAVGTIFYLLAIIFLTAFLFYLKGKKVIPQVTFSTAFMRLTGTVLILFAGAIVLSIIYGLVAVLLNQMLKSTFQLGQIKGIIDFIISAITIMLVPLFISIFWNEANCKDTLLRSLLNGVAVKGKIYLKLLILTIISFAIGLLIMTAFNYLNDDIVLVTIKTILMSLIGTIGLIVSENIIK